MKSENSKVNIAGDYINVLRDKLLKEEGFREVKELFPENEIVLFKDEGFVFNFCKILSGQDFTILEIEKNISDFSKKIIDGINILSPGKSVIRGSVVIVFPGFCRREKIDKITRIEMKSVKHRLHIIPVIVDLEFCEVFPLQGNNYYPDYPPGREYLKEIIPSRKLGYDRTKAIFEYKEEFEEKKKLEHFRKSIDNKTPYITWILLMFNIFMWFNLEARGGSENISSLIAFGANDRISIWNGEYWRLISSIFIHIGLLHLLGNSVFLYICGPFLEAIYGSSKFLVIYTLSGLFGSVTSLLAMKIFETTAGISAGSSGALFGILGALLSFITIESNNLPAETYKSLRKNLLLVLLFNIFIVFIIPNIDIWAHIGGFITGISLGYIFKMDKPLQKRKNKQIFSFLFLVMFVFLSLISLIPPKNLPYYNGRDYLRDSQYVRAEEEFKKAVIIQPERFDIYLYLGITYLSQGKVDIALTELEKALERNPSDPEINFFIGATYYEKGELDKAIIYYNKTAELYEKNRHWYSIGTDNRTALVYKSLGELYRVQKKWNLAIENTKKAIEINPLLPSAYSTLGLIYFYQKKLKDADMNFDTALKLSSDNDVSGLLGFSLLYMYRGKFDKASDYADKLKKIKDQAYMGYIMESEMSLLAGNFDNAIKDGKTALELSPDYWYTNYHMARLLFSSGSYKDSLPYILRSLEFNPNQIVSYSLMISIYKKLNSLPDCIKSYALNKGAGKVYCQFFLASSYYYNKEIDRADSELEKLMILDGSLAEAQFLKAFIIYNKGSDADALKYIEDIRSKDPYDDSLAYFHGYLLLKRRDNEKALKIFSEIQDLSNPLTYCGRACEAYIRNDLNKSQKFAEMSMRSYKNNIESHIILAMIAEKRRDYFEVIEHYKIVLQEDPNRKEAVEFFK